MKLKPLWIRTFCLFSWIGVLLWSSLPVEAQSNQKADSTMRLLVQSLSRELKTLQQNVSSLNSLVAMQQKQHKIEIANLQKRVQQQQAALQDIKKKYKAEFAILQARLKKLKSRPAAIAKQPTPAVVKPAAGLQGAPSMGPANAKITIVEYSDFQCPFCTRGSKTIKQLMKDYKGKIRLVFRHFPLSFHKDAHLAAQASMAAHAQGKFWAYHDKLFGNNSSLRKPVLQRYAKELGLDMKKFNAALNSGKYKAYVDKDLAAASRAGANGTPTFLINKHKIVGAQPIENFKRVIDAMLAGKAVPSDAPAAPAKPTGPVKPNIKGAPSDGPANAKVTIVEFSDFQCPFCSRGSSIMKQVKKAYGNKVRLVFKHLPLNFHKDAHLAAQASMAAHAQGKFWAFHDKLFANNRNLKKADLQKYAKQLGLDMKKFNAALNSGKYKKYVDNDLAEAGRVGANGTPTFFINGVSLVGAQPFDRFKSMIDAALAGKPMPSADAAPQAPPKPTGPVKLNIKGAPADGPANAKVTIVEFSDFQCPFCTRGSSIMKQVKKAYGNKVRLVFKHLPLSFHQDAHLAAQASMAAHEQGKFWAFHDKLFANNSSLKKADLQKYAKQLGLDMKKFNAALNSGKYKKYVDNDRAEAGRAGADGTPTFFVNGKRLVGAQPFSSFKQMIDAALKK